jgi:hypothetical protein
VLAVTDVSHFERPICFLVDFCSLSPLLSAQIGEQDMPVKSSGFSVPSTNPSSLLPLKCKSMLRGC